MPKQKDWKRVVRARMRKTGESYTAARAQLVRGSTRTAAAPPTGGKSPLPGSLAARAGSSDATVRAKTGRSWQEWVEVLDAAGAAALPHGEVAELVHQRYGVSGWWSQSVTVGYERIKGLRAKGQRRDGAWEASKSKTVAVSLTRLYRAFRVERERRRWLPEAWRVRTAIAGKSMRATWPDGTAVDVYFVAKGRGKSQVAIQHRKLTSGAHAEEVKRFWAERLSALARVLAAGA